MTVEGMAGSSTVHIEAPPERVWSLVSDVTRMGDWSPETYEASWVGEPARPEVGARFKGRNRRKRMKWSTTCTVVAAEPGREFTFVVGKAEKPVTRWSYQLTPSGTGTDVTESWESVKYGAFLKLFASPAKAKASLDAGVAETLARLKASAEQPA
jgi:uncharacterized protein YndB with AHSA1/START domain